MRKNAYLIVANLYPDLGIGDQLVVVVGGRGVHQATPLGPGGVGGGVVLLLPPLRVGQTAPLPLQVRGYSSPLGKKKGIIYEDL